MPAPLDISGKQYGDITVLSRAPSVEGSTRWNARCSCGTEKIVEGKSLTSGRVRSCGCRATRRTESEKRLNDRYDQKADALAAIIKNPATPLPDYEKAEKQLRRIEKARAKHEKQIINRKQATVVAKSQETSATEIERLAATYVLEPLPAGPERTEMLRKLHGELAGLSSTAFVSARFWVLGAIGIIDAEIESEKQELAEKQLAAEKVQAEIDTAKCKDTEARIRPKIDPVLRTNNLDTDTRASLQTYCKKMVAASRKYIRETEMEVDSKSKIVVARYILNVYQGYVKTLEPVVCDRETQGSSTSMDADYWENVALSETNFNFRTLAEKCFLCYGARLYFRNTNQPARVAEVPNYPEPIWPVGKPNQSLEGLIARDDVKVESSWIREQEARAQEEALERLKVSDPKKYQKLMESGPDALESWKSLNAEQRRSLPVRKQRSFQEIEALLKPVSTEVFQTIYLVPTFTLERPNDRPAMYFPDGRLCINGRDVIYDAMLKSWCLFPEPVCADFDNDRKQRTEMRQDDFGNWKQMPVDPEARYEQNLAGHFVRVGGAATSPFAKPTRIKFEHGDRHVEGSGRDFFHYGSWWTKAEIDSTYEKLAKQGFSLCPPLKIGLADSVTSVPPGIQEARDKDRDRKWGSW